MRPFYDPGFAKTTPLMHATRFTLDGTPSSTYPKENDPNAIESDTGELGWYDAKNGRGVITVDTPRTQALIGFVAGSDRKTENLTAKIPNRFCAIQLSSLDDQPIAQSEQLLLTTTALATNAGIKWKDDRKTLEAWGVGPAVIEPVSGQITLSGLSDDTAQLRVTPLTVTGRRLGEVFGTSTREGQANLRIGEKACTWYLIERMR